MGKTAFSDFLSKMSISARFSQHIFAFTMGATLKKNVAFLCFAFSFSSVLHASMQATNRGIWNAPRSVAVFDSWYFCLCVGVAHGDASGVAVANCICARVRWVLERFIIERRVSATKYCWLYWVCFVITCIWKPHGNPESCAFRPSCPTGFPGVVFVCFIRFWASRGPPGGVSERLRSWGLRPILDHFGVHFGAHFGVHFGSILDLIWGDFCWKHEAINSTSW